MADNRLRDVKSQWFADGEQPRRAQLSRSKLAKAAANYLRHSGPDGEFAGQPPHLLAAHDHARVHAGPNELSKE
jgi:hypothetical protein